MATAAAAAARRVDAGRHTRRVVAFSLCSLAPTATIHIRWLCERSGRFELGVYICKTNQSQSYLDPKPYTTNPEPHTPHPKRQHNAAWTRECAPRAAVHARRQSTGLMVTSVCSHLAGLYFSASRAPLSALRSPHLSHKVSSTLHTISNIKSGGRVFATHALLLAPLPAVPYSTCHARSAAAPCRSPPSLAYKMRRVNMPNPVHGLTCRWSCGSSITLGDDPVEVEGAESFEARALRPLQPSVACALHSGAAPSKVSFTL